MREFINKNISVIVFIAVVIGIGIIGFTFAYTTNDVNVVINTGEYAVVYSGTATLPTSKLQPVVDSDVTNSSNASKVLKIAFTVKGAQTNPTNKDIIYDVSLANLKMSPKLRNKNLKWMLIKNNEIISRGSFAPDFDIMEDNRIVLTNTQQDLPSYSSTADSYVVYIWISEGCVGDITNCTSDMDVSPLINKTLSGEVRVELLTGSKKKLVRKTGRLEILADATLDTLGLKVSSGIPDFSKTSCSSGCQETTVGLYETEDDLGVSYYFRGNPTNNYVKFGKNSSGSNMYWRIVRINGDGTVRMIYMGTSASATSLTPVGNSYFNTSNSDNTHIGYMNGSTGQSTYALTHSNKNNSSIKTYLEGSSGWYYTNIVATGYRDYVADAIYCNDRSLSSGSGIGTTTTYYGANARLTGTTKTPTLKCDLADYTNDKFTVSEELGNGTLQYPVGLIIADEIIMAGGSISTSNTSFYLNASTYYWTMTPNYFNSYAYVFRFYNGQMSSAYVYSNYGVLPVISLKSDALKYGTGTASDPFSVE